MGGVRRVARCVAQLPFPHVLTPQVAQELLVEAVQSKCSYCSHEGTLLDRGSEGCVNCACVLLPGHSVCAEEGVLRRV